MDYSTTDQATVIKAQIGQSIDLKKYLQSEAKPLIAIASELYGDPVQTSALSGCHWQSQGGVQISKATTL
jgi:hypothetical protein